jgi:LuxR family maltose regulon positive regulatory protein
MIAPVLAAALRELGNAGAARAVLADRLDVLELSGGPETLLLSYLTLAKVALDFGEERLALHLLDNLELLASRRKLPRLLAHALAAGVRVHAHRGRPEAARRLLERLRLLRGDFVRAEWRLFQPGFELLLALAQAQYAIATENAAEASDQVEAARALSLGGGRVREHLQACALAAVVARMRGDAEPESALREAAAIAELGGLRCVLLDAHPSVAGWLGKRRPEERTERVATAPLTPSPGGLLTPKEAQVLALLSEGLGNKAIARALDIGEETVKWHLKNLFAKLSAGSRKHAVGRARLLGLLPN